MSYSRSGSRMIDRLLRVDFSNFRSYLGHHSVPLDGDVVLIYGPNGSGKSSLLSALEYGITGEVVDLKRYESDYPRSLQNTQAQSLPSVRIQVRSDSGEQRDLSAGGDASAEKTSRALTKRDRHHFAERCFLSQARLARLLEIYQATQSDKTEQPLVRFIRELLGLRSLENLSDGLFVIGDRRRLEKASPEYSNLKRRSGELEASIGQAESERNSLRQTLSGERTELGTLLQSVLGGSPVPEASDELRSLRERLLAEGAHTRFQKQLEHLQQHRSRARASLEILEATDKIIAGPLAKAGSEVARIEKRTIELTARYLPTVRMITKSARLPEDSSPPEISDELGTAIVAVSSSIESQITRYSSQLKRFSELEQELDRLLLEQAELSNQIATSSRVPSEFVETQRRWIEALGVVAEHTSDDNCPVCGRDYSEIGTTTLQAHIESELTRLGADLDELSARADQHARLSVALSDLSRKVVALRSSAEEQRSGRDHAAQRLAQLEEAARHCSELAPVADEWKQLNVELAEATARLESLATRERQRGEAEATVREMVGELGVDDRSGESESEIARQLCHRLDRQIESVRGEARQVQTAVDRLQAVEQLSRELEMVTKRLQRERQELSRVSLAVQGVDSFIATAREVRNTAAGTQSRLLNQVFSDSLNRTWGDLFQRLARGERFTPSLSAQTGARGTINVNISCSDGTASAFEQLASVLSMGNLNTAALTLFLSLHLIEQPRHKVVILDDPVQNMDDVHVMNLAGLLRSVAFEVGRQVVIAVHERALFEYLKHEFAPSTPEQRTIAIELGSGLAGPNIQHEVVQWKPSVVRLVG